ncbi:MAG TPA: FG-GAP-like repeat-containing protein, partial [Bacteroidia bacterium]|nr:FG-GAP-like repeat-containing protein [Bacteroidia bacterium]
MKNFLFKTIFIICCSFAISEQLYSQSAASITTTNPLANADNIVTTSNVSVTYNDIMIAPSASNTAMRVFGNKRGAYSNTGAGTYSGVNTSTITYNPTRTFFPGELLSVVNNGNTTNGIINSRPTNFNFWAIPGVGLAQFSASTTSSLSLGSPDRDLYEIQNADLDNDGDLDIVFSRSNQFGGTSISYSLNNGLGAFGAATTLIEGGPCCFGNYVTSFTLGDYNHDGDVDIAVSYSVTDAGSNYFLARFSNNGAAVFTQTDYSKTEQYDEMISADMDADGDIDIVGVNRAAGTIVLNPNNVSGAFNITNINIALISGVYSIVAGDFNGDRRMDIASTRSTSNFIRISLQPASGTTYTTLGYNSGTSIFLSKIKILDLENDGDLDVAALNTTDGSVVFMQNAAGALSTPTTVTVTGMSNFDVADYDGDGDLDLGFAAGNNSLQIYKNTAGAFSSFSSLSLGSGATNNVNQMCSGDFDGDGDIDVVGKPPVQNPSFGYPLRLLKNNNNQVFTSAVTSPTCVGNQITVSWTVSATLPTINDYFIQLSDASGSFASPTFLGSVINSGVAGSLVVTIPNVTPGSGYRIRAFSNTAGVNTNDNGSNIQIFAGIDISVSSFCDINSTYLSANSGTSGVTYTWSPATGLDLTTGADVVASPSSTTTYYCTGTSPLGCVDVDTIVVEPSCYCPTINLTGNCNAVNITQVVLNSLSNSTGCSNLNGTAYNIYPASGNTTTSLVIGNTYSFSVRNGGTSNCTKVAWFDWDRSGTFDASEFVNIGTNIPINTTTTVTVTVPVAASSGLVGIRVREVLTGTTIGSGNACTLYSTGETEDYFITLDYPMVTGLSPVQNDNCFTTTSNLVYTFNTAMSNTATNAANYKINGFKKGLYTATASGATTNTITYNPTANFKPGERVMVTLTTNMQSTNLVNMNNPLVYEFVAKAGVGPATFLSEPIAGVTAGTAGDIGVADFNGDGNQDFVIPITGSASTTLQFYTGNGAGGFSAPTTLTTPQTNPITIEPADWDNDGDMDFIVGYNNVSAPQVTLYRNNGTGTFTTVAISLGTSSGLDIASADFDGDGDLDLVTVNAGGTDINYVRNNGAASFTLVDLTNTTSNNFIVVPGDFNGDNAYDIAVADISNNQIDIYTLKIGSGFSLQNSINTSGLVTALKTNDFNGDGILDLVWTQLFTDSVGFSSGNGDFTFGNPFMYSLTDPSQMDVADFDGDCDLDLAINSTSADLYIMKNDGSGNFTPQIGQSGGFSPVLVKSGDFDGDADIDLVAIRNSSNTASFLRNAFVTVTTGTITGPICNSPTISVPWTANSTLNNIAANVELSDALGSFSTPTILLSTNLNGASGTITGVPIPIVTAANGYRIRVRPTAITATAIDNGANLGIGVSPNLAISSSCSGNNTLLNLTGAVTYQWSPVAGLSSSTSANVTAAPSAPTVYTYFGKDAGGCQSINYTVSVSDKCYCYPTYNNLCSSGDYISNVSVNTLVNNTGGCSGHQFNFTAVPTSTTSTTLTRGSSYNISITPNGGSFAQGIGVWMDFNQDNDYNDAGEFVYSAAPSLTTVSGLVFIPVSSNLGLVRMRVRAMYNVTPIATDACSNSSFGETEDYIITVSCVNPTVFNVTGGGAICDGVGVSVGLNNSESTSNYTLYLTGSPLSSLQGTGGVLNFTGLTAAGTYSIQAVSASGCSATMSGSATVTVGTALEVASTNPISNNPSVTISSNINTTFNTNVAAAAASQTYFKVYGNQTGLKAGVYSLIGTNSLRLNPTNDFKPGEEITAVHISGTPGTICNLDTGYTYRLTAKAGVGPATFNPTANPAITSSIITGVTAADFNADGKVDYAFIGRSTNNLYIALNSGTGNFTATTTIALPGFQPSKINTGDFDNDGDIDLVIGASNSGVIKLYKNNGTGTFSLFSNNNSGYTSNCDIEVADFNVDGFLDVVVTAGSGTIQILRNDGAGTLNGISVINSSFNHRNIAIIDLHKDGLPDVVATNTGDSFIDFFENNLNPLGNLSLGVSYSINTGIGAVGLSDVTVSDLDNDNDEDIVVGSVSTGRIAVLKNNYPSPFTVNPSIVVASQAFQIVTADFDGDADIDIAVTDSLFSNSFALLKNTTGNFTPALTGTSCNAKYLAAADLDNDADIDLVGIDFTGNSNLIENENVYITTTTNVTPVPACPGSTVTVTWNVNQTLPAGNVFTIELSDDYGFFGGGNILTTVASQTSGSVSVTLPSILFFSTNYYIQVTSSASPALTIPFGPFTIYDSPYVSNLNSTGTLFCGDPITISVDASFEFLSYNVYLDGAPLSGYQGIPGTGTSFALGQFSNQGVYTVEAIDTTTGCVSQMNGSITINAGVEPIITSVSPLQNDIDINRNSNIDITFNTPMAAISSYTLGVPIYVWGDKTGLISGVWTLPSSNVMRFNPDVNLKPGEIISITVTNGVNGISGCNLTSPYVFSFTVKGAVAPYNFVEQYTYNDGNPSSNKPVVADFNGDNILDVAYMSLNFSIYKLNIKLGQGLGALGTTSSINTNGEPAYLNAADFDNDGDLDLYTLGNLDILIYANDGNGNFTEFSTGIFTDFVTPTVADFDGDGLLDILANEFNSGISVIYINLGGFNFTSYSSVSTYFFGVTHFHADFDNDGDEDFGLVMPLNDQVRIYSNNGGSLTLEQNYSFTNLASTPVVVNDLNGDNRPDIYFRRTNTGDVTLINNGGFSFTSNISLNSFNLTPAGGADFDGDGDIDIPGANSAFNVVKGLNNGSGTYTYSNQATSLVTSNAAYGDMDGDFDIDMVTVGSNGEILVLLNQPASSINTVYTGATSLCPSQTITVSYNASGTFNAGNNFIVQLSDASGSFASPTQIGIVTSTALSGNIVSTIPAIISNGSNYLIRVISDNPALIGTSSAAITISNFVTPTVSIVKTPGGAQCAGTSLTFTATPVNGGTSPTYQWFLGGSPILGANASTYVTSSLVNGNQISCQMTSSLTCVTGAATSNTINVNVTTPLVVSLSIAASPTGSQCAGTNIAFTATPVNGGASPVYQWKVNGTPVGINASTYSTTTLNNGDIVTCELTSSANCVVSPNATSNAINQSITTPAAASVSIAMLPATPQCIGTNLTFTATPSNGGASPTYQWLNNGSPISGANSSSFSSSSLADGDDISVIMTTSTCALPLNSSSSSISVSVLPTVVPSVSITASSNNICAGTNVVFTATPVNGGASPVYEWRINGVAQPGFTGNTFNSSSLVNGDVVRVRLTSSANCASPINILSGTITMIVNPTLVPSVTVAPSSTSVCTGTNVTFTATPINGGTTPIYQWFVDGSPVGINQNTFSTSSLTGGEVVSVDLTSNALCASPTTVSGISTPVTINPTIVPSVSVSASATTICAGTSILFTANPVNGGSTPTYQWRINGSNVPGANNPTFSTTSLVNGDNVTVRIVSSDLCASPTNATSSPTIITVNPLLTPTVSITSTLGTSICNGQIATFTSSISNGGASPGYQWRINGADVSGAISSTFNSSILNNGDVVSLVLTSNATCASPSIVTSSGITMTVDPVLIPAVTISTPITTNCENVSIVFTSSSTNQGASPIYQWNINGIPISGANAATFTTLVDNGDIVTLTMSSNAVCANPAVVTSNGINMIATPLLTPTITIAALPGDVICQGETVNYTATPSNQGLSPIYNWFVNGITVQSGSSNLFNTSTLVNGDVVSCELVSSETCVSSPTALSNQINMTVNDLPTTSIISGNSSPVCFAASETYSVVLTPGSNYIWSVPSGATILTGATGPDNNTITVSFSNLSGAISVTETNSNGCVGISQTLPISLSGCGIVIDFNANVTSVCAGQTVTFTNAVTGSIGATDMNWNFGTGASPATIVGNGPHTVTYNTPGPISVTLTLSGDYNGTLTKSNYIQVNPLVTDATINLTNASCGINNGSIQITGVTGGQAPFTYDLNGGGFSFTTLYSGLSAGNYILTVNDNNGCSYSENVSLINVPGPTSFNSSTSDATCGSNNGSINVTSVIGGISPYSYSLDGVSYVGTTLFSGLAAGSYTMFVKDNNNCVFSQGFSINNLGGPSSFNTSITDATCGSNNGSINVTSVTGGISPYSYSLDGVSYVGT